MPIKSPDENSEKRAQILFGNRFFSGFKQVSVLKKKITLLSVSLFSTAVLIGDTVNKETNIVNQQKLVKNLKWQEADQLAIYKACRS